MNEWIHGSELKLDGVAGKRIAGGDRSACFSQMSSLIEALAEADTGTQALAGAQVVGQAEAEAESGGDGCRGTGRVREVSRSAG